MPCYIVGSVLLFLLAAAEGYEHFVLTSLGAVGDGITDNTDLVRSVVARCERAGGCTIETGSGSIVTGPFNLTSNMVLRVSPDSWLIASDNINGWEAVKPLASYCQGRERDGPIYQPFIGGVNLFNVTIEGGGVIDGQGRAWWKAFEEGQLNHTRPRLIQLLHSRNITVRHIALRNAPFWTVHFVLSSHIHVHDVDIRAPRSSPNTDGINPDSSSHVLIERCRISCGDDAIAIKSGLNFCGREVGVASENITVRDCLLVEGYGLSIGSETSGGVRNVLFQNIVCEKGIGNCMRIKSGYSRGGVISDIVYDGIRLNGCERGIRLAMNHTREPYYNETATPTFKGIHYRNIRGSTSIEGMQVDCFPNRPCELGFQNVHIVTPKDQSKVSHVSASMKLSGIQYFPHVISNDEYPAAP